MTRVIKVGGSMLDWAPLPERLLAWLARQAPASNVFVAGGGEFVELIRRDDASHHLSEEDAHQLCLRALRSTARVLEYVLEQARITFTEYSLYLHNSLNVV